MSKLNSLNEVLQESINKGYAVGAFNVISHDMVDEILNASAEKGVPVILSVAEVHFKYFDLDKFIKYIKHRVSQHSEPVVLHLDHGQSFQTVMRAIHLGFSSVMFDGSTLPFEENIEKTSRIVEAAHAADVSVEAELGHVAGGEGNIKDGTEVNRDLFTKPEEAKTFVEKTDVDALAVAVGTVHGLYKGEPDLDFDRLKAIRKAVDVPLVLHGGSGLNNKDFKKAVECGINKINYFTGNSQVAVKGIKDEIENKEGFVKYPDLLNIARKEIKENVKNKINTFKTKPLDL